MDWQWANNTHTKLKFMVNLKYTVYKKATNNNTSPIPFSGIIFHIIKVNTRCSVM